VLINYAEYERVKETIDILSDTDLMRQIRKSQAYYNAGQKGLSFDEVFDEPLVPPKKRRR
jgi:PHD/YefM family antitoxin component YafN of YafNO toxin-antitoxin module